MQDKPNIHQVDTAHDGGGSASSITDADLHAYVDRQLSPLRRKEVEAFLSAHPAQQERVLDWQTQNVMLHSLLDPVLDEPLPHRLPVNADAVGWPWRSISAGVAIALVSAGAAWTVRGRIDAEYARLAFSTPPAGEQTGSALLTGFAHRAAVAHFVYCHDGRRPVELGADQEQALVTWLTKRMGADVHAPSLRSVGYELLGGRLLPGGAGPVAQFMYGTAGEQRLTVYVTREVAGQDAGFKFAKDGAVNVFYWVDDNFGYAISAAADKATLTKVSEEVYRQLKP